jgi:hypothetical protein
MKIIITEEEKLSILGLHNENYVINKKVISEQFDASTGTYKSRFAQLLRGVQTSIQGKEIKVPAGTNFWHDWNKAGDKVYFRVNNDLYYYDCAFAGSKNIFVDQDTFGSWSNDPLSTEIRRYFCNGNKIKTWKEATKGSNEVNPPPGSAVDTENPKDGLKIDANCKNKNPYNAFVDAGLNWKVERQKWIDAKCNGTTPCILGNATTNINLRNALCSGTWPLKKDTPQTPEQIQACSSKCEAKPTQPGQVGSQVQGWFNSDDNVCYEGTGTGGFASKEECEACKCPKKTPQQQVVSNAETQVNNTVNNVATQLKQFPNLTFGVRTR